MSETLNHLIDAMDSEYISKDDLASFKIDIDATGKLLNGYINFLRIGLTNEKEKPGAKDTDENIEAP